MIEPNFQFIHQEISRFRDHQIARGMCSPESGLAVSIVHKGFPSYKGVFGLRDREQQLPVTQETLFSMASVTKAFVATAFVIAHDEGCLDLNTQLNVNKTYIELKNPDSTRRITLRDILSHRTGLASNDLSWLLEASGLDRISQRLRHFDFVSDQPPIFIYNNLLYSALSEVFGAEVGLTLENFIQQRLFEPLGMDSSTLCFREMKATENKAVPYHGGRRFEFRQTDVIRAAGGLYSNLNDMTRWLEFWLNDDVQAGVSRHAKSLVAEMFSPQVNVNFPLPIIFNGLEWLSGSVSYGLGWFIGQAHGQRVMIHPGLVDGFSCAIALVPETQTGVIVMMNENLSSLPGKFIEKAFGLVLGWSESAPQADLTASALMTNQSECQIFELPTYDLAGVYYDPGYGTIKISKLNSGWNMQYGRARSKLSFCDIHRARVDLDVMGCLIPVVLMFTERNGRVAEISAPFALDPRVPERIFRRLE